MCNMSEMVGTQRTRDCSSSLGWKPEDGRRASKAQPRSTTSGFLPGVFIGEKECIGDTEKQSPTQIQANHRGLGTETLGDGK